MKARCFGLAAVALVAGCLSLSGCGSSGGNGTGTVRVVMVDAPDPSVSAVNITIDRVEAHVDNAWIPIATTPQSFNLLDLVFDEAVLGSATLPTGRYNQVRFFPSNATVTDADGTHPLAIASADQTGVKVNVDYTISSNEITTILLDFNVSKSVVRQGNGQYRLQPVIPAVVKVLSGTVTGSVTRSGAPVQGALIKAVYAAGSSYPVGTEVNSTLSLADGSFKIWALLPGTYTLSSTWTDPSTSVVFSATMTNVEVSANQNTAVGNLALE